MVGTGLALVFALAAAAPQGDGANLGRGPHRSSRTAEVRLYAPAHCPPDEGDALLVCGRPLTDNGVRALALFSRCAVWNGPRRARALVLADPGMPGYRAAVERFIAGNARCAPQGELRVTSDLLVGGLAEALLAGRRWPSRVDPRHPVRARDETEYMSLCVIGTAPAAVRALFAAAPASAAERRALDAMQSPLDACLASGRIVRLNSHVARAMIASAAYRLSQRAMD